ncbi:MAG TPA: transposase [Ktedonobacterales bacterium]|nr:transposase [Ktedonobacterales bacterium]
MPHGEFGFDVIALVGQLRYAQHRSLPEIYQELCTRGVVIAERTVTNLLARYEELPALRLTDAAALRDRLLPQGQVILGLDGLKPDVGHEVLWVLRDCLSGEVLLARSLLSEAEEELAALIHEAQTLIPVPITGVISDGQIGLRHAVAKALPDIPHQPCQYHYLREAAKPIYEADRHAKKDLKAFVRDIRPVERLTEGVLTHQQEIAPAYMRGLSEEEAHIVQDYCLAVRSALTDDGQPPLCAAGLRLQERLTKIGASLQQAMLKGGIIGA